MNAAEVITQPNPERRMDAEFTVSEINRLYLWAIQERARTNDADQMTVNLSRKLAEYRRRINS